MTITRDMEIGEVVGPSCPCEIAGEWVETCEAHPVNPEARGCPCECHTRKYRGVWAHARSCRDCGRDHVVSALSHGPPRCTAAVTVRHSCVEVDGHDGDHREQAPARWRSDVDDPGYLLRAGENFNRDILPHRVRAAYEKHIDTIRLVAREHGYAIGVHGSLARDIDLIAVPWVEEASAGDVLARAIEIAIGGFIYNGDMIDGQPYDRDAMPPEVKPHGRLAWSLHVGGGPYIDLSVMPRAGMR